MANLKLTIQLHKCIFPAVTIPGNIWISRSFVTTTRPLQKIDKETCEKVKEAAEVVRDGIKETRQTGEFLKETMNANAGEIVTEMAKKAIDLATEDEEEKTAWEKLKDVVKKKVGGDDK